MKKLIIVALAVFVVASAFSQNGNRRTLKAGGMKQVDASEVPDAVKSTLKSSSSDVKWEKYEASGKAGKSNIRYVAIYTQDGARTRARFKEDGTAMSSSKYMLAQKLPSTIQTAAAAKNPGARVVGGEELTTQDGKIYYRVRTRSGGTKSTTLFDANGVEITKDKIKEELKETEGEDGGD